MDVTIHTFVHFVPYVGKNVIEELYSALVHRQHTPHVRVSGIHLSWWTSLDLQLANASFTGAIFSKRDLSIF
jgi:hypothetical protein